jgi:hypothetical protein
MGVMKPLTVEELGQHAKQFDVKRQWTEKNEKGKTRAYIDGVCPVCHIVKAVSINDIRNHLRGIRSQMPGTCRKCKYSGRIINYYGYVMLFKPDHPNSYDRRYVLEHVYVMSEHLGRPITKEESVHHIDGDKTNNDISNLQLRTRYHGKGQVRACGDCGSHNIITKQL